MNAPDNEKRRIFCIITQGELGGAQQFVLQLAHHLNQEKFDLHIVWGGTGGSVLGRYLPPHVSYSIVPHLVREISLPNDLRAAHELKAMIAGYRPDIVLCISSKAGFVGSFAANRLRGLLPNMRIIYRIGGWTFNDPWPAWKKKFYIGLEKFSAKWKDIIVVNNAHDQEQARKLGIKPRRSIQLIHNGIDPYLDSLPREEARQVLGARIPEQFRKLPYEWLIGTIANLYPAKDLATLIRAAARLPKHVRCIVIGDGEQRAELERQIIEYDLDHRFFLLGSMPQAYKYLSALDVFVLPSVKEGFPWAVLEAMAAKVPVVATRVGAIPEMLEDHVSGILIDPQQPEQLAQAIMELLGSDRLRQELAIQAHQQVITHFSLRSMIDQYERLFEGPRA